MSLATFKRKLFLTLKKDEFKTLYPEKEAFFEAFSADKQNEIVVNEKDCIFGAYPTLTQINQIYGKEAAQEWEALQLVKLMEFLNYENNLNANQIIELSYHIYMRFQWLKVSEFMLFLWLYKEEEFGEHYGRIEPAVIFSALRDFVGEDGYRSKKIREIMQSIEEKYYELHDQHVDNSRDFLKEVQGVLATKFVNSSERKEE